MQFLGLAKGIRLISKEQLAAKQTFEELRRAA
jgi:hypothetical protein